MRPWLRHSSVSAPGSVTLSPEEPELLWKIFKHLRVDWFYFKVQWSWGEKLPQHFMNHVLLWWKDFIAIAAKKKTLIQTIIYRHNAKNIFVLLAHTALGDVSPSILRTQKVARPDRSRTSSLSAELQVTQQHTRPYLITNVLITGDINIVRGKFHFVDK